MGKISVTVLIGESVIGFDLYRFRHRVRNQALQPKANPLNSLYAVDLDCCAASGVPENFIAPGDYPFWERLNRTIREEPREGAYFYPNSAWRLPTNIPVKDFWSVIVYDNQTRSKLQTDRQAPRERLNGRLRRREPTSRR